MPKNIFFMSFLYVFIACVMFVAFSVHSQPTGDTAAHIAAAGGQSSTGNGLHKAGIPWHRQ